MCKTYPCGSRSMFHDSLWMARRRTKKKAEKKEEENSLSKDEGRASRAEGRGREGGRRRGKVTLHSIKQGNTIKIVRAARGRDAWRDANPVFHSS